MEVTNVKDHVTNATVGYEKVEEMGIDNSPEFFHILSSSLYKHQTLAMVREVLSNAVDAHTDAQVTEPVEVTVNDDYFIVKDKGTGIPPNLIKPIYGTYGSGTKRNDDNAIGGFGLGCKSPFAYTDNFEVTSCYAGVKTVYRMSKGSKIANGKPSIITILSVPCGEETGITVTIPIHTKDIQSIKRIVSSLAYLGELTVELNDNQVGNMGMELETGSYLFSNDNHLPNALHYISNLGNHDMFVRYANILYPLPAISTDVPDDCATVLNKLSNFKKMLNQRVYGTYFLVVQAAPNTLSVQPSRESLSETGFTYESLTKLLTTVVDDLEGKLVKLVHEHTELMISKVSESLGDSTNNCVPYRKVYDSIRYVLDVSTPCEVHNTLAHYVNKSPVVGTQANSVYDLLENHFVNEYQLNKDFLNVYDKELYKVQYTEFYDTQIIGKGYYGSEQFFYKWYRKLFTPLLNNKRIYVYLESRGQSTYKQDANYLVSPLTDIVVRHPQYLMGFRDRPVIVTTNLRKTTDRISEYNSYYKNEPDITGALVYHVPIGKKNVEQAMYVLRNSGYKVYDFTKALPWEKTYTTSTGGGVSTPRINRNVKADSLPALSSILDSDGYINTRLSCTDNAKRVEKPIANILVRINKSTSTNQVEAFNNIDYLKEVIDIFGDQIGIVGTSVQKAKWDKVGNTNVDELMVDYLVSEFKKIKTDYVKYQATTEESLLTAFDEFNSANWVVKKLHTTYTSRQLRDLVPFKVYVSTPEIKRFNRLYDVVCNELNRRLLSQNETRIKLNSIIPESVPSKSMVKFLKQVEKYPAHHLFDLDLDELASPLIPEETLVVKHLISQVRKVKV
jgi:hypothetical protein